MAGDPGAIPGINWTQVTPEERARLQGLIRHYRGKPHPFTACVRDNTKRFGEERAKRICAVLKDLIEGGTGWRKGGDGGRKMEADRPLDRDEIVALCEQAEALLPPEERAYMEREMAWVEAAHPRNAKGSAGGGKFKAKGAAEKKAEGRKTVKWAGKERTKSELIARLAETGVPVEAWAWKHKAMARHLGIPIPAKPPTAALRKLDKKLSSQAVKRSSKGADSKGVTALRSGRAFADLDDEEIRAYAFDESKHRRIAKGSKGGGRFTTKLAVLTRIADPDKTNFIDAGERRKAAKELVKTGDLRPEGTRGSEFSITPQGRQRLAQAVAGAKVDLDEKPGGGERSGPGREWRSVNGKLQTSISGPKGTATIVKDGDTYSVRQPGGGGLKGGTISGLSRDEAIRNAENVTGAPPGPSFRRGSGTDPGPSAGSGSEPWKDTGYSKEEYEQRLENLNRFYGSHINRLTEGRAIKPSAGSGPRITLMGGKYYVDPEARVWRGDPPKAPTGGGIKTVSSADAAAKLAAKMDVDELMDDRRKTGRYKGK